MPEATTSRGRPRSGASRDAVLRAAFEALCERGYAGLAIEHVAGRAGVGKATIYRWWPDRATLAVDSFFAATRDTLAFPDTGSVREDFRQQVGQVAALLRTEAGAAMAAMAAGARHDPALGKALAERWVIPRKQWGIQRMQRAVGTGECPPDLDIEAALGALYSPLYAPLMMGRGPEPQDRVDAYLEIVLRGIFGPAGAREPSDSAGRPRHPESSPQRTARE
ncbi:MAG: TetR/AcrR family transcriptional regulator [Gemmatimonadaceae bacterium]|nr:TetR/AcrR family transcriptional regulator [Acetobacteraceae bacterium]